MIKHGATVYIFFFKGGNMLHNLLSHKKLSHKLLSGVMCTLVPACCNVIVCWWTCKTLKRITNAFKCDLQLPDPPKPAPLMTDPPKPLMSSIAVETNMDDEMFLQVKEYDHGVEVLNDMYAGDWCYDKTLVVLSEDTTMNQALQQMHASRSTCALLYGENDALVGILDTRDIVRFVLRSTFSMNCSAQKAIRRCIVASANVSVNEICKHLCSGMRYIAVCSTVGGHQIVSQRAMVAAILSASHTNEHLLQQLDTPIPPTCLKQLICCYDSESAKRAYEIMAAYNITSLPIVDQNGLMRGVISATDILYTRNDVNLIHQTVMTFVENSRRDANISRNVNCIVSCKADDSLITVLRIMLHEEVHHIYLLEDDVPLGVISFVDILQHIRHKIPSSDCFDLDA